MALSNCGGTKKEKILYLISILHHFRYTPEEVLNLEILNLESKDVDSTIYYVNDSKVESQRSNKINV
jgi:hypothetical protein